MEFRALDVRRSPAEQGYSPNSYDLIIASNVLHATPTLEETMANARTLLRPGGHLVVVELTNPRHSRIGFIFGLFADWWAGVDDGRVLQPYVSIERWDEILKKTGFSGITSSFEDPEGEIFPTSVFRSEAVNDKVAKLYQPLSFPLTESSPSIVVVGGATSKLSRILQELKALLPIRRFETFARLEDVHTRESDVKPTFLLLSELDDPMFTDMTKAKFEALKVLTEAAKHMLWVTEDAWLNPVKALAIGFIRTLRLECIDCSVQVLDIDDTQNLDAEYLAETLLRLEEGSNWQDAGILWTTEPEIYVSQGRARIPRLKPDRYKNDRLNSNRRELLANYDPKTSPVALHQGSGPAYLQSNAEYPPEQRSNGLLTKIKVRRSLARAVRVSNLGHFNLVEGICENNGCAVVALSEENRSLVDVVPERVVALPETHMQLGAGALLAVAADLMAQTLIEDVAPGASIVLYSAPNIYAKHIAQRARTKRIRTTFISAHPRPSGDAIGEDSWIQLHHNETTLGVSKVLPRHVSALYNFAVDQSPVGVGQSLSKRFAARGCPVFQADHLASLNASAWTQEAGSSLKAMLEESVRVCLGEASMIEDVSTTPAQELVTLQRRVGYSTIVDWTVHEVVSARVRPIDSGILFSDNKTYLLIGLTGDLGRSICRWMLGHGAKHVVLSSRHPQVQTRWLDEMHDLGGNVLVLPM